jgi:hypothetical protein
LNFRSKIFLAGFFLCVLFSLSGTVSVFANPYEELGPDSPLYQRVKNLETYGLLDPQDQQVLDEGKYVTRLELAFYTEKAKAHLTNPELAGPPPTSTPVPIPPTATPVPAVTLPSPVNPAPPPSIPVARPAGPVVAGEIGELLKELHEEAAMLKTRLALNDQRINDQEKELEALQSTEDEVKAVWTKANKTSGAPNFNTNTDTRFEQINVSGPASVSGGVTTPLQNNATRLIQEVWIGMWTDLGGLGAFSTGFGAFVPYSNASDIVAGTSGAAAAPASVYVGSPALTLNVYGDLGKWDTTFAVEAYQPDADLGDFSRGVGPYALHRFEDPFDIKHFSTDKDAKNWDDFMNSIGFVSSSSLNAGNVQSTVDRVFDGMYTVGHDLPGLGNTRVHLLVGRMGESPTQTQRWEEGAKIDEPWDNVLTTSLQTEWVNDEFGVNQVPQVNMKDYSADMALNLHPVFFDIEGGFSDYFTGYYADSTGVYANPQPIEGGVGQASLSFYPFTLYAFALSDSYADFQSKVMMAGIHFNQYGQSTNYNDFNDVYGGIGEVDNLVSDRYGWRVNLGWDGRKQDWMKDWPSFLDTFIVNLDVAQKMEFVAEQAPAVGSNTTGYYTIEPFQELSFYYPDDEGLWGLNLWGGYSNPPYPLRENYINNIEAIRNDNDTSYDDVRYQFQLSSERIPLIYPVYTATGAVSTVGGYNQYINLDNLKTYNYITLTLKMKMDKWFNLPTPLDGSFYMTQNQVSGVSTNPALANVPTSTPGQTVNLQNIPNLFQQKVFDYALMVNVVKNLDLSGDIGVETWNSSYTYPLVAYQTNAYGLGLAWDIPWGGGKLEFRYKHIDFTDTYVPNNNYSGNQYYSRMYFLF